ncbi:hypothetical protein J0X14_16185 [Muricauda sp. CAU 1633]|uniref:hypothetical protein n=1 Tax=Allomuricauda sp. CAU 1633 TaxID=2816036 RepID=UPI001A9059F3|nr:hypothetical protein [Muricauda sp. CAU 1633]MBO0323850.1 hypothetical protein [Muricauda sp. CAU 1633]
MNDSISKYLLLLCIAYAYIRLFIAYIRFFARYMFNEKVGWDKYIERPRLVFYGIGLLLMHTTYSKIMKDTQESLSVYSILNLVVFVQGFVFSQITWSKMFKGVFIPSIKKKLRSSKNFNISASKSHLDKLYDELVRYEMLRLEQTTREDFLNALTNNWNAHESKIHFNLDSPSAREFYEFFTASFPSNSMTLKDFFETSNVIRRPDGRPYNYSTIKNAPIRTPVSKRNGDLQVVFSSFQNQ